MPQMAGNSTTLHEGWAGGVMVGDHRERGEGGGEEGGGFPFYNTLRQDGEEVVGRVKVVRGICGWAARQLDGEVRRGGWKLADADVNMALLSILPTSTRHTATSTATATDAEAVCAGEGCVNCARRVG